jgi:hypothetical protein
MVLSFFEQSMQSRIKLRIQKFASKWRSPWSNKPSHAAVPYAERDGTCLAVGTGTFENHLLSG